MNNLIKCNIDLIVIIAHRINTLSICNKLLILEKGKMVDFGSKVDILKKYKYLEKYFEEKV